MIVIFPEAFAITLALTIWQRMWEEWCVESKRHRALSAWREGIGHRELATRDTEYRSIESPCECAEPVFPKGVEETEAPNND